MADEQKVIRIVVDSKPAVEGANHAKQAFAAMGRATGTMQSALEQAMSAVSRFGGLLAAAFGAQSILRAADAFTQFGNSLKVAGVYAGDLAAVQERLFAAANRNGIEIGALSTLYSRASMAAGELGASQDKLLKFTDGVTAALRVQGGSTEQASGALLQLSQSLSSGIVRAEEFNSVLEGAYPIAQAAARGIDGMGGSVGKLRAAVAEGHVTSQVFFNGLLKGFEETEKQAATMNLTVAAATTVLHNGFIRAVGSADQLTGASSGLASAIAAAGRSVDSFGAGLDHMRDQLPQIAENAAAAGVALATAFAPATIMAMTTAMVGLGRAGVAAIGAITAAMAANPIGAIAVALTAAAGAAIYFRDNIKNAIGVDIVDVAKKGANFLIGSFVTAYHEIEFVWKQFGNMMGAAVTGGLNAAVGGINWLVQAAADKVDWLVDKTNKVNPFAPIPRIGAVSPVQPLPNRYADDLNKALADRERQIQKDMSTDYLGNFGSLFAPAFGPPAPNGGQGGPTSPPQPPKTGQEKSYDKLVSQLQAAADAQDKMTAAADRGDVAYQQQKIHLDAVQKSIEIFGQALDDTDPRLRKIEELIGRASFGKMAEAFSQGTNELRNQNDVLAAQIRLMGEAPEIQARELALIKATQDAKRAGIPLDSDRFKARQAEIEQNETLKGQAEELKRANELWTAPLKSALESIQRTGADAWESILESGKLSFESLGDVFTKTVRRMAAELLALATVRPVMSVLVSAAVGGGIVSPATAGQMGFPQGIAGSPSAGGAGGGLGGGLDGIFGGGWSNKPIFGGGIDSEIANWSTYGTAQQGAQGLFSANATWGQALGAVGSLAGIGFGVHSLANARGTGGVVSGVSGILGGALGLASFIPGLQFLAPIGAILGMGGGLLGGLLGDSQAIPPAPPFMYSGGEFWGTDSGGWRTTGISQNGGSNLTKEAGGLSRQVSALFRAAGLSTVPGQLIGGVVSAGQDSRWENGAWQPHAFTNAGLLMPGGGTEWLTGQDTSRNLQQASEFVISQVFKANVMRGGVSGVTPALRAGVSAYDPQTAEETQNVVALAAAYDKLGKAANPAKDAIDQLSASFDDLKGFAEKAGLSLDPINDELKKQSTRAAQDFIDNYLNPVAVAQRALADERDSALSSAEYIRDNFKDVYVDINRLTEVFAQKQTALLDQAYGGAITNLQALIKSLTYGDLASADPRTTLAGLKAEYSVTRDLALGGDASAIAGFSGIAGQLADYGRSYYASGPDYQALRQQVLNDAIGVSGVASGGGAASTSAAPSPASTSNDQQIARLTALVMQMQADMAKRDHQIESLTGEMKRIAVNQRAMPIR